MENQTDERQMTFEEAEHRSYKKAEQRQVFMVKTLSLALDILSDKMFLFIAMVAAAGLFSWCMLDPSPARLVGAFLFSLTVFLPTLLYYREKKNGTTVR